jgi:nicotinate-nucleotide pyrophosphorylase (carboxylating)
MPRLRRARLARKLSHRIRWTDLDPAHVRRLVAAAREEDLAGAGLRRQPRRPGDVTTASQPLLGPGRAALVAREELVVCGLPVVALVLRAYGRGARLKAHVRDGAVVRAGEEIATLTGPAKVLLPAERVLLNFLQRLSGIATTTRRHVAALGKTPTRLLDTRKTTPGWRMLEKYAVACGGACNHRLGLFDRVMLKDNHLAAAGATAGDRLAAAVRRARTMAPGLPVEVEVDTLAQIPAVLAAQPNVILLDNFSVSQLRRAVALVGDRACTEASGGVTLRTLPRLAHLGLDFISTGALVHHSVWVDIGLDWR